MWSPVESLADLYTAMGATITLRRRAAAMVAAGGVCDPQLIVELREILAALQAAPAAMDGRGGVRLGLDGGRTIVTSIKYEVSELEKDLAFLAQGEDALVALMRAQCPGFDAQVERVVATLQQHGSFRAFLTDRDGTVNNYCDRYLTSVQSAYNAVFLQRFVDRCSRGSVILTSAPLGGPGAKDRGIVDISVMPGAGSLVLAGSKGRTFLANGAVRRLDIPAEQQAALDRLNERLLRMIREPSNVKFGLIGSGLQFKFGNTTVARQDVNRSVPEEESRAWLQRLRETVHDVDPSGKLFRIEDTGLDVELILTVGSGSAARDFSKGDGVAFIDEQLKLGLADGPTLVCGDTSSDLPMLAAVLDRATRRDRVAAVFVTQSDKLKAKISDLYPATVVVDHVDVLVYALGKLGRLGEGARPRARL